MEGFLLLAVAIGLLALFDMVALRWGFDSRITTDDGRAPVSLLGER